MYFAGKLKETVFPVPMWWKELSESLLLFSLVYTDARIKSVQICVPVTQYSPNAHLELYNAITIIVMMILIPAI